MSASQEELSKEISAIRSSHAKLEEKVIEMLDKLKSVRATVEQQAQNLCVKFKSKLQASRHDLEAAHREFETRLVAVEARKRCGCGRNVVTSTDKMKRPKFDGFAS
jgi:chromosome segregation ATPase